MKLFSKLFEPKVAEVTIEQIHAEVDSAQDRLLEQAIEVLARHEMEKVGESRVEEIGERLKRLGFVNVPVAKKTDEIRQVRHQKELEVVKTKEEAALIQYYKHKYPFLKFLTESELSRICSKYGLVWAPNGRYIKEVPEKNLREIENCQELKDVDSVERKSFVKITNFWRGCERIEKWLNGRDIPMPRYSTIKPSDDETFNAIVAMGYAGPKPEKYLYRDAELVCEDRTGLFIAAPPDHFDLTGLKQTGLGFHQQTIIKIQDPIVFRYVIGGVQVITKWGLEGNDPALVVPALN